MWTNIKKKKKGEKMGCNCGQAAVTQACVWHDTAEASHLCVSNSWFTSSRLRARFPPKAKEEGSLKIGAFVEV